MLCELFSGSRSVLLPASSCEIWHQALRVQLLQQKWPLSCKSLAPCIDDFMTCMPETTAAAYHANCHKLCDMLQAHSTQLSRQQEAAADECSSMHV
jgi:hypothetical protein